MNTLSFKRVCVVALCFGIGVTASYDAKAMSADACNIYTDLSTAAFGLRLEGVPKRKVMDQNEFEGVKATMFELAVIRAFTADIELEPEQFRAKTFRSCRAGEL